jgi:hypothetical protein
MTMVILSVWEVVVDKDNIMEFAGLYLDKCKHLTVPALQKFIMSRDEVGKAIRIEDIEVALDKLCYGGFIKIVHNSPEGVVYEKDRG